MDKPKLADSGLTREVYPNAALKLSKHPRGFFEFAVVPGRNTVLKYTREQENGNAHIKLVTELVIEMREGFPLGRELRAEDWVAESLYRYGGPRLQFESVHCRGTLRIVSLANQERRSRDQLNLIFFEPSIDVAQVHEAPAEFNLAPSAH